MNPSPGSVIHVNGDLVGRTSIIGVRCLVVKVTDGMVYLRAERYPTKAELKRGDYDPYTKRVWKLPMANIRKRQGDPHP